MVNSEKCTASLASQCLGGLVGMICGGLIGGFSCGTIISLTASEKEVLDFFWFPFLWLGMPVGAMIGPIVGVNIVRKVAECWSEAASPTEMEPPALVPKFSTAIKGAERWPEGTSPTEIDPPALAPKFSTAIQDRAWQSGIVLPAQPNPPPQQDGETGIKDMTNG